MTSTAFRLPSPAEAAARAPAWLTALTCTGLAGALAWLFLNRPTLAILAALPFAALPLVLSGRVRTIVVVFGSLAVFQSSEELTAQKLAFFMAVIAAFGAVLARLPMLARTPAYHDLAPLFRGSLVLFGLVLASFVVSSANDIDQKPWLRDVTPYVLVGCAPFFALDAYTSFSQRGLRRLVVIAGSLGALAFSVTWLTNRGIADLSAVPIGLPTMLLPGAIFAYAMSAFLVGEHRRLSWLGLGSTVIALLLATGTRTSLLLVVAPLAITFGSRQHFTRRSMRLVVAVPLVALIGLAAAQGLLGLTGGDRDTLAKRFDLVSSTGAGVADRSYLDRVSQTDAAWRQFRAAPLFGAGPGTPIEWEDSFGRLNASPNVDSPVSFLTKFGAMGLVAVGFLAVGYIGSIRRMRARAGGRTVAHYALVGYGVLIVAWSLVLNSFEDKGLAIGLLLLLALAAREATERRVDQEASGSLP